MQGLPPVTNTRFALLHGLKLFLATELRSLGDYRRMAREFLLDHLPDDGNTDDLVVVIDEALTNVVRHSYGGQSNHTLQLQIHLETDPEGGPTDLTVIVVDRGEAGKRYSPSQQLAANLANMAAGEASGFGLVLMYRVMDSVEYWVTPQGENRLVLHKCFVRGRAHEQTYVSKLITELQDTGSLTPA
jgi:anti-sigma regulatory factor (Ser/Thr protein kinase)